LHGKVGMLKTTARTLFPEYVVSFLPPVLQSPSYHLGTYLLSKLLPSREQQKFKREIVKAGTLEEIWEKVDEKLQKQGIFSKEEKELEKK